MIELRGKWLRVEEGRLWGDEAHWGPGAGQGFEVVRSNGGLCKGTPRFDQPF